MKKKNKVTFCSQKKDGKIIAVSYTGYGRKKFEVSFNGGSITSDGGLLLLRHADKQIGLTKQLRSIIKDNRRQGSCLHDIESMLKQRIYGIALGYEDINDHISLRKDKCFQTALNKDKELASSSTLSRFENTADKEMAYDIHKILFDNFISSHDTPPKEIILDFDPSDITTYGSQDKRHYHGYYGDYCFLPLYVYCGDHLLCSYLRPSNIDGPKHAWAILSMLVKNIRKVWPEVKIVFRGDSAFCRDKMLSWCDRNNIDYVVGIAKNNRLLALTEPLISQANQAFDHTLEKQRLFGSYSYAAGSWKKERKVIIKAEHLEKGRNSRFIVTNVEGDPQYLYEKVYCARGDMENRIKETQLGLFGDRTSCHGWWPNQLRCLLSSLAYVLVSHIRRAALSRTELATAQVDTIRVKLLKIGAIVLTNSRTIKFLLATGYPYQDVFFNALELLTPS